MIRVYTAGPYRSKTFFGVVRNIYRAWKVTFKLWKLGFVPLCPHLNSLFMSEIKSGKQVNYIAGDLGLVKMCDAVLMLKGWVRSEGANIEREFAFEHHIPVMYSIEELMEYEPRLELRRV